MKLVGASPRHVEPIEVKAARLEERLKRIAPRGLLATPNGESVHIADLKMVAQKRPSAFDLRTDALAEAAQRRALDSGIKAIRHVVEGGGRLMDAGPAAALQAESVVDAIRRVSWYVENGDYVVEIRALDDGLDEYWRETFEDERARVREVCASVAAIIIDGKPIGTGWLAAPDTLVTNAHVAFSLCYRKPGLPPSDLRDRWRMASGRSFTAAFRYEHGNIEKAREHLVIPIEDVLHVETSQQPDLAVFRLASAPDLKMPLPLGLDLSPEKPRGWSSDTVVYTVGHPISDLQGDAANVGVSFVGLLDGTKRFSPGKVMELIDGNTLAHDCSTTNGSSGSPLLGMGSTAPIALHYFGRPGTRNEAALLSAWAAHPAVRAIQSGQW